MVSHGRGEEGALVLLVRTFIQPLRARTQTQVSNAFYQKHKGDFTFRIWCTVEINLPYRLTGLCVSSPEATITTSFLSF